MISDEELDHTPLRQGKYVGQSPSQIAEHDPEYIVWMACNFKEKIVSDLLVRTCQEDS